MQYRTSLLGGLNSAWKCGRTLDMSVGGILIDTPEAVQVGATLELAIDWTGLYHGKPMVCLLVIGPGTRYFLFNFRLMTAFLRESKELRVLGPLEAPWKSALSS
jgi:hypothetical protein